MPLDAGLFGQLGTRPRSYGDYRQEVDTQAANALALKGGNLNYQNALQAAQEDAAYKEAARGFGADQTANYNALMQRGLPKQAVGYQKAALDAQQAQADIGLKGAQTKKAGADAGKTAIEAATAKLGYGQKVLQSASSPEQVAQLMHLGMQQGIFSREEAAAFLNDMPPDPNAFNQWREKQAIQGMDLAKKLELAQREKESARTDERMRSEGAANRGVQMRGQNMMDARTRESTSVAMSKPFEVTGPDGQPMLVQQDRQGNVSPVSGFSPKGMGATKLTEDQGKATGWLSQATNAYANMQSTLEKEPGAAKPGIADAIGTVPGLKTAGNFMRSDARQKYMQSASSMSEALLRAATGAGVNKDEALQKVQELTPQFGDSDAVVKQKMDAIPVYIESLKVRAGPGAKQVPGIMERSRGSAASGPKAGAVEAGYRFKGGDPADPKNWEKQ